MACTLTLLPSAIADIALRHVHSPFSADKLRKTDLEYVAVHSGGAN